MTKDAFYKLKVGDVVHHPQTGNLKITRIHEAFDYENRVEGEPVPKLTISFETKDGRYCKVEDHEVANLTLVK